MRYKTNEEVMLAGSLPVEVAVTIRVIDLATDSLVAVDSNVCSESNLVPGMYVWSTANITDEVVGYKSMYYEMTDGEFTVSGKFVYGGYIDVLGSPEENATALVNRVI